MALLLDPLPIRSLNVLPPSGFIDRFLPREGFDGFQVNAVRTSDRLIIRPALVINLPHEALGIPRSARRHQPQVAVLLLT